MHIYAIYGSAVTRAVKLFSSQRLGGHLRTEPDTHNTTGKGAAHTKSAINSVCIETLPPCRACSCLPAGPPAADIQPLKTCVGCQSRGVHYLPVLASCCTNAQEGDQCGCALAQAQQPSETFRLFCWHPKTATPQASWKASKHRHPILACMQNVHACNTVVHVAIEQLKSLDHESGVKK
jgi:hypothetical protein